MAGSHHHSTCRALLFYRQRDGGRRRVVVRELYWDTCIRDDLCDQAGKSRRPEARVITNRYALTGVFVLEHVRSDRARHSAYVLKGVIIGDDAAPTVGTELDLGHKSFELGASSYERASRSKYCRQSIPRACTTSREGLINFRGNSPQGLKPRFSEATGGRPEGRPFQSTPNQILPSLRKL